MDKTNSKILTLSFAASGALVGLTISLLIRAFSGAFGIVARLTDADLVRHGVPVLFGFAVFAILQFNPRILAWAEEVVVEVRKVVWPSRKDTVAMTIVVLVMVAISSVIITGFDGVSGYVMKWIMG